MCSLPTRIGSAAHSAWGHASAEDDDLAWLAKAKAKAKAGPRLQTNGGSPIAIASLAAIAGMFIMMDSRAGDQRLVLAGQWPGSLLAARLALIALIALAAMVATTISLAITAAVADVRQWGVYIAANLLVAATYALIGVLIGPLLGRVAGVFIAFLIPFVDLGISQSPMLRATPAAWAHFLPGYGAGQIVMNGILGPSFDQTRSLLIALAWLAALATAAVLLYHRTTRIAARPAA